VRPVNEPRRQRQCYPRHARQRRCFDETVRQARERFADIPPQEIEALIDEAVQATRNDMREERQERRTEK
jgi:hypothetical protein